MAKSVDPSKLEDKETLDSLVERDIQTHADGFSKETAGETLEDLGFDAGSDLNSFGDSGAPDGMGAFKNSLTENNKPKEKDNYDKIFDASVTGAKALWRVIIDMFKSFSLRTADDIGVLGKTCFISAGAACALGILISVGAAFAGWFKLGFWGMGGTLIWSSFIPAGFGGIMVGLAVDAKTRNQGNQPSIDDLPADTVADAYIDNIDEAIEDILSEKDLDILVSDVSIDIPDVYPTAPQDEQEAAAPDFDALEAKIDEQKRLISRKVLFDTFMPYFGLCTPEFRDVKTVPDNDPTFLNIYAVLTKVVADIKKQNIKDTIVKLLELQDTYFSYVLRVEKIKGITGTKGLSEVCSGLESYFRSTIVCEDPAEQYNQRLRVRVTHIDEGDSYIITISKGMSGIITLGDCLQGKREASHFLNEKNALPIVAGINEQGVVYLEDAQNLDNIMITGKQRSGKSWYVNSLITSLAVFNSPQEVAFIIIDPKQDILFDTFGLLPHVIGVHDQRNILSIMRELIDIEAERRAQTLKESKCSNIKQYNQRKTSVKMPRIYLFIDEVITVVDSLMSNAESDKEGKKNQSEFKSAMKTIMSKLPYVGIGLIFVPHRAVGLIDKTARALLKLKAAVMADEEEIIETVGKKIDRSLTAPGDIALQLASLQSPKYVRGSAIAADDDLTVETLERIARGFYKLGVEVPDRSHLKVSFNRDENYVNERLFENNFTIHLGK